MSDGPKRVPDDARVLQLVPNTLTATPKTTRREVPVTDFWPTPEVPDVVFLRQKQEQLQKVEKTVALLRMVEGPVGASFVLGAARGRLAVMRDLGYLSDAQYRQHKQVIKAIFAVRWPDLLDDTPDE